MVGMWHLGDLDLIESLTPEEQGELQRSSCVQKFDAGETVFRPSGEPKSVYLLVDGAIRIYRLSDKGSEATFGYVQPGEVFGELAALIEVGRESYAEATTPSVVWCIPIDLFRRLLGWRSGVGIEVSRQLAERLKRIERRVEGLMFHDARRRLAVVLRELADHFGVHRGGGVEIDGDFTQAELATIVGCSRQTLNQCLRELEGLGLAEMKRRRVRLSDLDALREFIEHGPPANRGG